MRKASPEVKHLARRLLRNHTAGEGATPHTPADALRLGCEALRLQLTPLVGTDGFRALLSRSLALAKGELPWLGTLQVHSDGRLSGFEEILGSRDRADEEAGCAAILACFLTLLTSFIGVGLTRQLVSAAWPDSPVRDTDFSAEEGQT